VGLTADGKKRLERELRKVRKAEKGEDDSSSSDDDDDSDNSISAPNTLSKVNRYNRKASRWIKINQCANSCCVFAGKLHNAFACPFCGAGRFKLCVRSGCKGNGESNDCDHLLMDGVAIKNLHYRLLIPLLTDLINTEYFVSALHYINDKHFCGHVFVPRPGRIFVPRPGHFFMPRPGHLFVPRGTFLCPDRGTFSCPDRGTFFVPRGVFVPTGASFCAHNGALQTGHMPRSGHEKVPRSIPKNIKTLLI
jgi:hypothetical protein